MKKLSIVTAFLVFASVLLSACGPFAVGAAGAPTAEPQPQMRRYEAQTQSVQVQVQEGNPQQASAVVRGILSEACARLDESRVEYSNNTYKITVYATSPTDHGCAAVISPFETTVALDIQGKPAGTYTVTANGVDAVFTLKGAQPAPSAVPTAAPSLVPTTAPSQGCTDSAAFVSDISVPDNVLFSAGTPFTKTWRIKNTGTCTWTSDYLVYYISGATMSQQPAYRIVQPGQRVEPGQTVDISVGMTAPMDTGYYTSYWGLKGRDGRPMPVAGGASGNSFYVKIRVTDVIAGSGKIIDQGIEIELEQGSGEACTPGATYLVHAHVTTDGPLSALYEVDSTAGQIAAGKFVDPATGALVTTVEATVNLDASLFAADGTQTATLPFRFVGPYPYPDNIQVNFWVDGGSWVSAKVACP